MGMPMFAVPDLPLQHAVFRAYNSWLVDYCSHAPQRLLGLAMISLDDVDWAVAEFKRTRDIGLRGACISIDPRLGSPTPTGATIPSGPPPSTCRCPSTSTS